MKLKRKLPDKPVEESLKVLTREERTKFYDGDLLMGNYDVKYLKKNGLYDRTIERKARFWCHKIRADQFQERKNKLAYPKGWKKFVEDLPGFAGWKHFAVSWDIVGTNPFMIVLRLQSVWEEWDQVMNRVSIPIDTPPEQLHERLQVLADEFRKKNR